MLIINKKACQWGMPFRILVHSSWVVWCILSYSFIFDIKRSDLYLSTYNWNLYIWNVFTQSSYLFEFQNIDLRHNWQNLLYSLWHIFVWLFYFAQRILLPILVHKIRHEIFLYCCDRNIIFIMITYRHISLHRPSIPHYMYTGRNQWCLYISHSSRGSCVSLPNIHYDLWQNLYKSKHPQYN